MRGEDSGSRFNEAPAENGGKHPESRHSRSLSHQRRFNEAPAENGGKPRLLEAAYTSGLWAANARGCEMFSDDKPSDSNALRESG